MFVELYCYNKTIEGKMFLPEVTLFFFIEKVAKNPKKQQRSESELSYYTEQK